MSAVPSGPGMDIWRSCRFIGVMMRSLCLLPAGLGWFVPCSVGRNHCRLRHNGGKSVVMDLPRDHGRVLRRFSWMSIYGSSITLLGLRQQQQRQRQRQRRQRQRQRQQHKPFARKSALCFMSPQRSASCWRQLGLPTRRQPFEGGSDTYTSSCSMNG